MPWWMDPRYPSWLGPVYHPPLEVWWLPIAIAMVVTVGWVGLRYARTNSPRWWALVLLVVGVIAVAVATLRYPLPSYEFSGTGDHALVVVLISPEAERHPDLQFDFSSSCVALMHPDDYALGDPEGRPHPGVWPRYRLDSSQDSRERTAIVFSAARFTPPRTPSVLSNAWADYLVTSCGGATAQAAWKPERVIVDVGTELWVRYTKTSYARAPSPLKQTVNLKGRCLVDATWTPHAVVGFAERPKDVSGRFQMEMPKGNSGGDEDVFYIWYRAFSPSKLDESASPEFMLGEMETAEAKLNECMGR